MVSNIEQNLVLVESQSALAAPGVSTGPQDIDFLRREIIRGGLVIQGAEGQRFVTTLSSLTMRDIGRSAVAQAGGEVARYGALLMATAANAASRGKGLSNRHSLIAAEAQQAVIAAFTRKYTRRSYRTSDPQRLSGKMSEALRSRNLMRAGRDGILMFNEAILDEKAAHWYRLNFGASPRGGVKHPQQFKLKFKGTNVGTLSLKHNRPSKPFSIPRGVFLSGGDVVPADANRKGLDQFYTIRSFIKNIGEGSGGKVSIPKRIPTRGIVGGHFFDAGVRVVAKKLPLLYETLLDEWIGEAREKGTGPVAKVFAITPP